MARRAGRHGPFRPTRSAPPAPTLTSGAAKHAANTVTEDSTHSTQGNIMNRKTFILVAALLAAAGARAQEATPEPAQAMPSAKTRAQVQQELAQARADGSIAAVSAGYDFVRRVALVKSRSQVQGEVLQARARGQLGTLNGEAHDFTRTAAGVTFYATR
jgi:hypothetical protein